MIQRIKDIIQGKIKLRDRRSSKWPRIRNIHLKEKPKCAACGGRKKLEVHHIKPFNKYPELELEPSNFITLCESKKNGVNCHLLFGHLGNYKTINPTALEDVLTWFNKITQR